MVKSTSSFHHYSEGPTESFEYDWRNQLYIYIKEKGSKVVTFGLQNLAVHHLVTLFFLIYRQ